MPGPWSNADATCDDAGLGTRTVQCVRDDGATVPDDACDAASRPAVADSTPITAGCAVDWVAGEFGGYDSACSSTATRTRTVQCQRHGTHSAAVAVADARCDAATRPPASETAKRFGGCTYAWRYGDWGNFDSTCSATATRTRTPA